MSGKQSRLCPKRQSAEKILPRDATLSTVMRQEVVCLSVRLSVRTCVYPSVTFRYRTVVTSVGIVRKQFYGRIA